MASYNGSGRGGDETFDGIDEFGIFDVSAATGRAERRDHDTSTSFDSRTERDITEAARKALVDDLSHLRSSLSPESVTVKSSVEPGHVQSSLTEQDTTQADPDHAEALNGMNDGAETTAETSSAANLINLYKSLYYGRTLQGWVTVDPNPRAVTSISSAYGYAYR